MGIFSFPFYDWCPHLPGAARACRGWNSTSRKEVHLQEGGGGVPTGVEQHLGEGREGVPRG
eukprot:962096-Prorocentrum_minimum.AAC.1